MAQGSRKHISQMHLFYELKQQYPNLPDKFVNHCIKQAGGDEEACRGILGAEAHVPLAMSKRPSSLLLDEVSAGNPRPIFSAPTTPCSVTRYAPQSVRPMVQPLSSNNSNKNGTELLIKGQLERKRNLEIELEKEKNALSKMKKRYEELNILLASKEKSPKVANLSKETKDLREECQRLVSEIDSKYNNNEKQLGHRTESLINGQIEFSGAHKDNSHWRCQVCTFQNHPLLNQCEKCDMPRITREETDGQNIHISVTHRKFPSCSVFHSWKL